MDSHCSQGNIPNPQKERAGVKKNREDRAGAQRQTLGDIGTEEAGTERRPGRILREELGGNRMEGLLEEME